MSSSDFFWLVYGLLVENSLLDDMDLEIVEEYYFKSERKELISFKVGAPMICVSCISVVAVIIASGFCSFHQVLGLLFRLRKKFDINSTVCLRPLRLELLKALRNEVHCHVRMSRNLYSHDNSEKLLSSMFTSEMSHLALKDDICDEFLQLTALKELWQLSFLLRSEYFRLFLLHLSHSSHRLILVFLYLLQEILVLKKSKASLSGNEISEKDKFLCVTEILRKAIEISAPETHIGHESIKHSNMSSNSSISEGIDETKSIADELLVEKVYEGSSLVSDDQQKDVLLSSWQRNESNEATARSVVVELKARLVERMREIDTVKTTKIDYTQRMITIDDEFQKYQHSMEAKATARDDLNTFITIPKNNDVFRSCAELDLQQAISFMKLMPSVDFIDDPGNES
ncbi:hypothetical protein DINM_021189 [Dirofilaria immitis]|nr:hypothetical protein [Dirofilaria immitis]